MKKAAVFGQSMLEQALFQELQAMGGHILKQSISEGLCPTKRTSAGAVLEELQPRGKSHIGAG